MWTHVGTHTKSTFSMMYLIKQTLTWTRVHFQHLFITNSTCLLYTQLLYTNAGHNGKISYSLNSDVTKVQCNGTILSSTGYTMLFKTDHYTLSLNLLWLSVFSLCSLSPSRCTSSTTSGSYCGGYNRRHYRHLTIYCDTDSDSRDTCEVI